MQTIRANRDKFERRNARHNKSSHFVVVESGHLQVAELRNAAQTHQTPTAQSQLRNVFRCFDGCEPEEAVGAGEIVFCVGGTPRCDTRNIPISSSCALPFTTVEMTAIRSTVAFIFVLEQRGQSQTDCDLHNGIFFCFPTLHPFHHSTYTAHGTTTKQPKPTTHKIDFPVFCLFCFTFVLEI